MKRVLGLGNALTDILLQVSEGDLREIGFPKGSMNLIDAEQLERIQTRFISVRKHLVAGGSASNTVATIAQLGGKAAFIGKIGNDEVGKFYREDLIKNNVKPHLLTSSLMSGCCVVLITPDGERTFCSQMFAPILDETAADLPDDVVVAKIDVDQNPGLAVKFGVRSIPSIFIVKDGKVVKSFMGVQTKETLLDAINTL